MSAASTPATKTPRQRKPPKPKVTCALCGKSFARVTHTHLRTHGYSHDEYVRTFGAHTHPGPGSSHRPALQLRPAEGSTTEVAENLLSSPAFLQRLADEVGDLLFTTGLRERLRSALIQILGKRLELHAAAVANLEAVRAELAQPWRVQRGGKDGAPTPTPHLVMVAGEAHQQVVKSEEALLKAIKLAVEEQRSNKDALERQARPAFTGEAESIPVPPSLPAHERETIRTLFSLLRDEAANRRAPANPPAPGPAEAQQAAGDVLDLEPTTNSSQEAPTASDEPFGLG